MCINFIFSKHLLSQLNDDIFKGKKIKAIKAITGEKHTHNKNETLMKVWNALNLKLL